MVAANADGVPCGNVLGAVLEDVGNQTHGVAWRVDVRAAGDVFLEDVVLQGAVQLARRYPLLLGGRDVEREEDGSGGVDRHGDANLVEGDAIEEDLHVRKARDGDACASDFTGGERMIGVVSGLGRKVECDAESGLPLFEQISVSGVGLLGRRKPGVLAHGPDASAVHIGLDAAGVWVFARVPKVAVVVEVGKVFRRVHGIDFDAGVGLEAVSALAEALLDWREGVVVPLAFVGGGHRSCARGDAFEFVAWSVGEGGGGVNGEKREVGMSLGPAQLGLKVFPDDLAEELLSLPHDG